MNKVKEINVWLTADQLEGIHTSRETKHTPGPWSVEPDGRYFNIIPLSPHWAVVGPEGIEKEADAHLIAAAPDMFAALESCREWVHLAADHPAAEPGVYDALCMLDAALAKARGEAV